MLGGGGETWDCTQRAGEVVFVPAGFLHATVNLDESVAVAIQCDDGVDPRTGAVITQKFQYAFTLDFEVPFIIPSFFVPFLIRLYRRYVGIERVNHSRERRSNASRAVRQPLGVALWYNARRRCSI